MSLFFDKVEANFRQVVRDVPGATPTVDAQALASVAMAFTVGRLHRFARSGYKRSPLEHLDASLRWLL